MAKIVINNTASAQPISDVGVTLAASSSYTIPPQDYPLWAASVAVDALIDSLTISINDGYDTLKPQFGKLHIHEETIPRQMAFIATETSQALAASTLTLTATSRIVHTFTGSTAGQIIKLPDATTLNKGHRFEFWNTGTTFLTIQNNGSISLISLTAQQKTGAFLQDNSTTNGTWLFDANYLGGTGGGNGPIVFGFDGNASTGRWLELATNVSTGLTKAIVAGTKTLRSLSFSTNGNSTCTITVFKNGVALDTISTSANYKNTKLNLTHLLLDKDELSAQVTSGSCARPIVFAWL